MDERVRLSRGSLDPHTAHVQPITGTPTDVPVPRKVIVRRELRFVIIAGHSERSAGSARFQRAASGILPDARDEPTISISTNDLSVCGLDSGLRLEARK